MILVSSNEWPRVEQDLGEEGISTELPFDFLLYTNKGAVSGERKTFPDDFIASAKDGRLAKELAAMREQTEYRIVILEGSPRYTYEGMLRIGNRPSSWSKAGIRNLIRSIRYVEGADVEWSENIHETVTILKELQKYFDTEKHLSLRIRPRFESDWYIPVYGERFVYWLQGCGPGISVVRAKAISKVFKTPMELFTASIEDIQSVPGIGGKTANSIYNFLRGIN